jgi:hypothetical protein
MRGAISGVVIAERELRIFVQPRQANRAFFDEETYDEDNGEDSHQAEGSPEKGRHRKVRGGAASNSPRPTARMSRVNGPGPQQTSQRDPAVYCEPPARPVS